MENEFRIREEITTGIKGTSQKANANRLKSRTLRSGYGAELESINFNSDSTDRYAEINTGRNFRTDYERGNTDIPQPPDEFLAEVYRQFQCNGADLQEGASGYDEQLRQSDKQCGEECFTTGWEHEREIFIQYQSGGGETESSCEDTVFPGFDTDSYYSKPQREEYFADSGFYKYHEAYHLLKFANEKQILEKAYNEYLDLKKCNLWGTHKYY